MATTNNQSSSDADHGNTTQLSPNEAKFTEAVKALLADNHTHHDLKQRLHQLVMEEAQKLPPIKVLFCASYGGFGISEAFTTFVHSHTKITGSLDHDFLRSDPMLIQAISDYGRSICDKYPFILDDMRTVDTWKLEELLDNRKRSPKQMEFNPDLVAEANSFRNQMSDSKGYWRADCLGRFPKNSTPDLVTFAEKHPDFWMAHPFMSCDLGFELPMFQIALRFAHILLRSGDHARYHVKPDEAQDAAIYERIGLCGASTQYATLAIKEIPALVDFSIREYDGLEWVDYRCGKSRMA